MMRRNSIKIIGNEAVNTISYYIKNENGEWVHVDSASPLAKREFTKATIKEIAEKIIETIDDVYNVGNRGVDIEVECSDEEFTYLRKALQGKELSIKIQEIESDACTQISNMSSKKTANEIDVSVKIGEMNGDISCQKRNTYVVVAGKVLTGKTTLIEELGKFNSLNFRMSKHVECMEYVNPNKDQVWYEVKGIDIGKQCIIRVEEEIDRIASNGMDVFIYCFSTNKVEFAETELMIKIKERYPNTRILGVLTSCVDDDCNDLVDNMSNLLAGIKVIPVLAKDKKTKQGTIPAYGLDEITKYIYGAKR